MRFSSSGLCIGFWLALALRVLHIFHSPHLWGGLLAIFEVALILFCLIANSLGTFHFLARIDAKDPMIHDFGAALCVASQA